MNKEPQHTHYDVVIVGGAIMGSSAAWWISQDPYFNGKILVVERDPTYEFASTSHTNSCIRQQFSTEVNIRISQFGVEFIKGFRTFMADPDAPEITLHDYGYMYLSDNEHLSRILKENQKLQSELGAGTRILTREQVAAEYPFYMLDDIILASHNPVDEGYFDGGTIFDWWRRKAQENGAEYIENEVTGIEVANGRVTSIRLKSGENISTGAVVNASGPRAALTAKMAGFDIAIEPRRRYTFVFDAETPLDRPLPLTIDPSGVHVRSDGRYYLCGCPPDNDEPPDFTDFYLDHGVWEDKLWPALANRIPAFEAIKVVNSWVGHYAFNTLDQNAVIGPHPEVPNFLFMNGFSGHGLQQSPAMGRAISELVIHGNYRTLDLSPLGYERVLEGRPFLEKAVI